MEIKKNISRKLDKGFDIREVSFEKIHDIKQNDFDYLIEILNIQENDVILDAGSGYGAVSREIISQNMHKKIIVYLTDNSLFQIERSINELNNFFGKDVVLKKAKFVYDTIETPQLNNNFFDIIVAKMVIHEIPQKAIINTLKELNRILKDNSKIVFWDLTLSNTNKDIIRSIIRKKDEIAGFDTLVMNRYFLTIDEWFSLLDDSGFKNVKVERKINYRFNSRVRLEPEFNNDERKLEAFHKFIRSEIIKYPKSLLKEMEYEDKGKEISFLVPKSIITAIK